MHRFLRRLWPLLALPLLQAASPPAVEDGLVERMRKHATPGLSIAVVDGGRIAWAKGYGVLERTRRKPSPVTTRSLFQMASISKPVAAIGALRLVERGQLSLDEDVNQKLTSWKLPSNDFTSNQPVTLRHLLTHTAGIRSGPLPGYRDTEPLPSLLDVFRGVGEQRTPLVVVDFLPGSRSSYSNGGFEVVQQLMTDAAHKSFSDLMRELVLKPAGMKNSTYQQPLPKAWTRNAATGHREDGRAMPNLSYPEQAAVGLWSTPSDLSKLAIELGRALQGKSKKLLTLKMAQEMFRKQGSTFGLAWMLDGEGDSFSFRHDGSNEGYRSAMIYYPRLGKGAVIAANGDLGAELLDEVMGRIAKAYQWPPLPVTHPPHARP